MRHIDVNGLRLLGWYDEARPYIEQARANLEYLSAAPKAEAMRATASNPRARS